MTKEQRQAQLDELKWKLSEEKGTDCCGEFDYCKKCDKTTEFPCADAYDKFSAEAKTKKASTTAAKKPAAAKSTAAKTTAKKTAK